MTKKTDYTWRDPEKAKHFLEEISGAIPLEVEQFDIMMRLISHGRKNVSSLLDIGCGNGILASVILDKYPKAKATLLDFSDTMLSAAEEKMVYYGDQVEYTKSDYGEESLDVRLSGEERGSFDVIVSRFSIHHQTDHRKHQIYKEVFNLLEPGGIFINIEHVAAASKWALPIFEEYMIDHLYDSQRQKGLDKKRKDIAKDFRQRHDKDANIITLVEKQCDWLRDIGFKDVDCYFKVMQLAIFAGRK